MPVLGRPIQRRPSIVILGLDISSLLQEQLCYCLMSVPGRPHKRRIAVTILGVWLDAFTPQ
jgi:hypothetical protein